MNFKYSITLQWSEEDGGYIAVVPEIPGHSAFGTTPEKAAAQARKAAELFLEQYAADGERPPAPELLSTVSGQLRIRMPKSLHRTLSERARREGTSLNSYMVQLLEGCIARREVADAVRNIMACLPRYSCGTSAADFEEGFAARDWGTAATDSVVTH